MKTQLSTLKALSDRNRLRIVAALSIYEELCACQITELLKVSGATASRHLSQLVNAEILKSRKQGRWVYYWLDKTRPQHQPIVDWLQAAFVTSREIKDDRSALKKIITRDPEEICRNQRGDACCPKKNQSKKQGKVENCE